MTALMNSSNAVFVDNTARFSGSTSDHFGLGFSDILDTTREIWNRLSDVYRSGDISVFDANVAVQTKVNESIVDPSYMVNVLIGAIGLGITDLEHVLQVKRATIYNWRKGGEVRGDASIERLKSVYHIAKRIAEFNDRPFGRRAKTHILEGKTYLQLLSEDVLDEQAIVRHAAILSGQENARVKAAQAVEHESNDIEQLSGGWQRL